MEDSGTLNKFFSKDAIVITDNLSGLLYAIVLVHQGYNVRLFDHSTPMVAYSYPEIRLGSSGLRFLELYDHYGPCKNFRVPGRAAKIYKTVLQEQMHQIFVGSNLGDKRTAHCGLATYEQGYKPSSIEVEADKIILIVESSQVDSKETISTDLLVDADASGQVKALLDGQHVDPTSLSGVTIPLVCCNAKIVHASQSFDTTNMDSSEAFEQSARSALAFMDVLKGRMTIAEWERNAQYSLLRDQILTAICSKRIALLNPHLWMLAARFVSTSSINLIRESLNGYRSGSSSLDGLNAVRIQA